MGMSDLQSNPVRMFYRNLLWASLWAFPTPAQRRGYICLAQVQKIQKHKFSPFGSIVCASPTAVKQMQLSRAKSKRQFGGNIEVNN